MRQALTVSMAALRWAARTYAHHPLSILGLSLVPTVQRFLVVRQDLPTPVAVTTEVLVTLVRLLLLVLIVRIMMRELAAAGIDRHAAWSRLTAGIDARRAAFWLQWVVLAVAFVIFDVIPNTVIALAVPEADRAMVEAVVVAVKNPTVIAFTFLWMAGVARTLIVQSADARAVPAPAA
ncbi:hypothetical protein [Micromonospora sp. WMMD812]|uniref:hypothetical protein n=1 Tax=Micromonospora sp. WMMD812 TaxID=3015152 RepID=UPI00248B4F0D|nr:hypothetical protein [Micromonospora sp. WMMD812]WBB69077.1 hypothetical protein O7603_06920 [Micromonospora sp. WMMD812]